MSYPYQLKTHSLLLDAVKFLEKSRKTIVPVISESKELLGVISDGDIRRALLNGASLQSTIASYMNTNPAKYMQNEEINRDYQWVHLFLSNP